MRRGHLSRSIRFGLWAVFCSFLFTPVLWAYSGGTGEPNDSYQIATAQDLIDLGNEPNDYGKCFVLTADIDLDPNLPGKVFDHAVIGSRGCHFEGRFDGNFHVVSSLNIQGESWVGLFDFLGEEAEVRDLGLEDVVVTGNGSGVGGLIGYNTGIVIACYVKGLVQGESNVGGLIGTNGGEIISCYTEGSIVGQTDIGGLVGSAVARGRYGCIYACYAQGTVTGDEGVGGLVGDNDDGFIGFSYCADQDGWIESCYSFSITMGDWAVGGLVGFNSDRGDVIESYSIGVVSGDIAGGVIGASDDGRVRVSFWDIETSGQAESDGGYGLPTAEMQDINNYLDAGWDFLDETINGTDDLWWMPDNDYPQFVQ